MDPHAVRRLHRNFLPLLCAALPILIAAAPVSAQTELRRGRTLSETIAAGDTARYTITADENDFVLGEVNQISVDVTVRVLGPDGTRLGQFGGLGTGVERFSGRTSTDGTHTIEVFVAGDDEDAAGTYEITLLRHEDVATDPKRLADQMMARFNGPESPGAAVRVWRDGRTLYSKTYGMANLAYDLPFEEDTRTNIGSTSKQFTAFAIMLQAERGLLSLDDDIRTHIPELPEFDETIQVRHLITHTSGLREFLNLLRMTGRRLDHGDWIDRSELVDIVQRQPALQNAPGAEWNYNNTAFGFAAAIVERTSGTGLPRLHAGERLRPTRDDRVHGPPFQPPHRPQPVGGVHPRSGRLPPDRRPGWCGRGRGRLQHDRGPPDVGGELRRPARRQP